MRPTLVIGAGAIGSVIADLLVRGGVQRLAVCDPERFSSGNISRHTLTLYSLGKGKADAVATRVQAASPTAHIVAHEQSFEQLAATDVSAAKLIFDCSGSDDVLETLSGVPADCDRIYVSISISFGARELYLYTQRRTFDAARFTGLLQPWLKKQFEAWGSEPLPREGIGCWHPVFPARVDEVWMMTAFAVNFLASIAEGLGDEGRLYVFKRVESGGVLAGVAEARLE